MKNKNSVLVCALAFAFILSAIAPVSASFTVSGAGFDASAAPGEHIQHEIQVEIDETDSPMDVVADVMGLYQEPAGGALLGIEADQDKSPYSAREFQKVTPQSQHIEPGESVTFLLEGDIPADIGDGGRYAIIDVRSLPAGEGQISTAMAVSIPVKITISGTKQTHAGEIASLETADPVSPEAPVALLTFNCTGNHVFFYKVDAVLKDGNDQVLATASDPCPNCDAPRAVPTYSRKIKLNFDLDDDEPLDPGTYIIEAKVSLEDGTVLDSKDTQFELKN